MEKLDFTNISIFALICLPGIIFQYVRSQFGHGRMPKFSQGIAAYISVSLLYHATGYILGIFYYLKPNEFDFCNRFILFAYFLLTPAALGFIIGISLKKDIIYNFLKKSGFDVVHPIPTAWDYCFNRYPESWVTITLKNGITWRGKYNVKAIASTSPEERDILIDQVCVLNGKKPWKETGGSVLISKDEIQSIEFHQDTSNHEGQK